MKKEIAQDINLSNGLGKEKRQLLHSNSRYQQGIEENLQLIKQEAGTWMKGAAIVGGILLIGYTGYKLFIEEDEPESSVDREPVMLANVDSKNESTIFKMIKESIALFLISIAKERIQTLIQRLTIEDEQGDIQSTEG